METRLDLRTIAALAFVLSVSATADAKPDTKPGRDKTKSTGVKNVYGDHGGPVGWCADELETLPNGLCYIHGRGSAPTPRALRPGEATVAGSAPEAAEPERRTLVIFLHGMIAKNVDWQWLQERALTRQAKASHFDAIFAKAPLGPSGYIWPGTRDAQDASEQGLIDGWNEARAVLEKRNGKPYDEVFVMGFSSGAYFTSSLALRGRVKADGFAVFAGGAGSQSSPTVAQMPPVFVGVCMDDSQTAAHSRGFGAALAARGWPHRIDEQHVGHMFADAHVAHAVAYLRSQKKLGD